MRASITVATLASAAIAHAASLSDVCTTSHVKSSLPSNGTFTGITLNASSVTANAVYNNSVSGETFFPDATFDYCNVTFSYNHNGLDGDKVALTYWLPAPTDFKNRFLTTGGEAYNINKGTSSSGSLPGGIIYGAVAGLTEYVKGGATCFLFDCVSGVVSLEIFAFEPICF